MADVIIDNSNLYDIADSIRAKLGVQTTYKPSQMADAIDSISGGGITPTGTISITENGTHDVTSYASASVAVPQGATPTGTKQISITENGTTTEDVTNYASAEITVNVSSGGSGAVSLLDTVTIAENTRSVNIDLSDFQSYNLLYVIADAELTASDWLYYVKNGSSATGGSYDDQALKHNFLIGMQINPAGATAKTFSGVIGAASMSLNNGAMTNIFVYTYSANTNIKAGSTFKVYGGNYADM